uniref:Uncharacterized protein n=1 Tax=Phytophthora ramorum TaxID=164328 RepID=H3H2V1_PHYRM
MAGDRIASTLADDARWHARLAALLAASGKFESAASHYRRALRGLEETTGGAPEDDAQRQRRRLQWQFELAATETKRGRRQDAIVLYEGILQVDSECVEAQVNLAAQLAIADASRLEEALELCMRALTLRPDLAEAHYNRNMLLRRLGRQEEAVNTYWECLARDLGDGVVRASMPDTLARVLLPLDGQNSIPKADKACNNATGDGLGNQEGGGDGVTVVCVKWGTKYGADGWKGWWNKCQLFSTALTSKLRAHGNSRCLYVDLDTVVVGNLGELMTWSPPAGMLALLKTDHMANEQRAGGYNSSIMAWRIDSNDDVDSLEFLYSFLHVHFSSVNKFIYKFDHWLEMAHPAAHFVEDTFPDQIVEYRSLDDQAATPPPNASIKATLPPFSLADPTGLPTALQSFRFPTINASKDATGDRDKRMTATSPLCGKRPSFTSSERNVNWSGSQIDSVGGYGPRTRRQQDLSPAASLFGATAAEPTPRPAASVKLETEQEAAVLLPKTSLDKPTLGEDGSIGAAQRARMELSGSRAGPRANSWENVLVNNSSGYGEEKNDLQSGPSTFNNAASRSSPLECKGRRPVSESETAHRSGADSLFEASELERSMQDLRGADTHRILALEDHWENVVHGQHSVYGDMSMNEYILTKSARVN